MCRRTSASVVERVRISVSKGLRWAANHQRVQDRPRLEFHDRGAAGFVHRDEGGHALMLARHGHQSFRKVPRRGSPSRRRAGTGLSG